MGLPAQDGFRRAEVYTLRRVAFVWIAACFLLAGASGRALGEPAAKQNAAARQFTDELGRSVKVPTRVDRVVSLAPNLTEIVYALGAEDRLAGDTDFCDFPPEAKLKPHVGGTIDPNLEQIARLMPDLVLASKTINRRETVDALERLGIPVYVTDPHSVEDMISSIGHIGAMLDADQNAAALTAELRAREAAIAKRLRGAPETSVFFVVWTDPLISIGTHTFLADALRVAGARSVLDTSQDWPRVGFEEVVRLQPAYLIFAEANAAGVHREIDELRRRAGWRDLSAMQQDRVVVISDAINRPAPRMIDAIEELARALHPQSFASRNAEARDSAFFATATAAPDCTANSATEALPCAR